MIRKVVRLPRSLLDEIKAVQARLNAEAAKPYSAAAVVRGLILIGLEAIRERKSLAAAFAGAHAPRGRRTKTYPSDGRAL